MFQLLCCINLSPKTLSLARNEDVHSKKPKPMNYLRKQKEVIMSLKKKKAPEPDGIHAEVLQTLEESLTQLLCSLCNECLARCRVPYIWKQSDVVIIRKWEDKDPTQPRSYRPICLLNVLVKLQERLHRELQHEAMKTYILISMTWLQKRQFDQRCVNRALYSWILKGLLATFGGRLLFQRLRNLSYPTGLYYVFKDYCRNWHGSWSWM